jgi:transcriptional regulator with GAF, ATPase, and Fis domain
VDEPIDEALLGAQLVGIALFDARLRCVRVNEEMARLAATPADALVGRALAELLGPARHDELAAAAAALAPGAPVHGRIVENGGLHLRLDYLPIGRRDQPLAGAVIVAADLTAQRRAESALADGWSFAELISELSAHFIDLDPDETERGLERAMRAIGERLDIDATRVAQFTDERTHLTMTHEWVRSGTLALIDNFREFAPDFMPWVAEQLFAGKPVVVHDRAELPLEADFERRWADHNGIQAAVLMPLTTRRQIIGYIDFSSTRPRRWTPDVLDSLRLTAELVASALDRKASDVAMRERLAFEEALSALATRFIAASVDAVDGAIAEALRIVAETLQYERATLYLFDDAQKVLDVQQEWCRPGVPASSGKPASLALARFGWPLDEIAAGKLVVADLPSLPSWAQAARQLMERDGFATWATVPLRIEEQVIGCIGLFGRRRRALTEPMQARLRLVGDTIAGALARQRAELARRRAFAELERLKNRAERERDYLREEAEANTTIVGSSTALRGLIDTIEVVAATGATVLIRGESGTGKELIARAIHERSPRRAAALVKVNCASVPKELFESEFFGHVRGAFTGAFKDRAGRFELADGGTLFLDEIGDIPLELQAKLLRVLQESEFERVGDDRTRRVDVRIVAATNRDLEADVTAGRFRQDLYYRISVFPLEVPPLRARRDDVVPLAEHFLRGSAAKLGRSQLTLDEPQRRLLTAYDWPGNVRELQHVIERAVILSVQPPLQLERALQVGAPGARPPTPPPLPLQSPLVNTPPSPPAILKESDLRAIERDSIVAALDKAAGRIAGPGGAAELLGVRPSTLRDRMKALGIQR